MSVTDDLLADDQRHAESSSGPLPLPPATQIAVLARMDARIDVYRVLGLAEGEAHVLRDSIEAEVGQRPPWASEAFPDLEADVRASVARITDSPFVPLTDSVRGFVFDVATGRLHEVG